MIDSKKETTTTTPKKTTTNTTTTTTTNTETKATIDNKKTEYSNIANSINKIGVKNLTREQIIDFINQYMKFIDNKNNDYFDSTIDNLVMLKQEFSIRTGNNTVNTILDKNMLRRQLKIGMTKNEVIAFTIYIKPEDINKTTTKYGTSEQYVYDSDYLYFEDGKLTSIQN